MLLMALLVGTGVTAHTKRTKQPHICFVLADDWGQYNAGYRGDPASKTKAIDALAAEGLVLDRFYVHKWCAPSRSSLMSGRNPIHTGQDPMNWTATILRPGMGDSAVHKDYVFLPKLLQSAGYESHQLGKWHLGSFKQEYTPAGRGFNTSFGFLGGFETYDTHMMWSGRWNVSREAAGVLNGGYVGDYVTDLYETDRAATDLKYNGTCNTEGVCTCTDSGAGSSSSSSSGGGSNVCRYSSYMYTEKAVNLIEDLAQEVSDARLHHAAVKPRFFYFAIQSVHSPYMVPQEYMDMFPELPVDGVARRMHAMVAALDDFVGNTTAALKRAGVWEDTLFILHADNGACQAAPQGPGKWHNPEGKGGIQSAGGTAYPYRSGKFNVWEGGHRVPAIISGGYLPSTCTGRTSNILMHISDWYATLAAVAGVPATVLAASNASGPKPLDSFDMSGILLGSTGSNNDVRGDAGAGDNVNIEVGVNSIAYVGAGAGAGDGAAAATCGVDRLASPRTTMMYFYGDDHNGAYTSGDFKLVMGIDHKWGLWEQQWCLAGNYSGGPTADGQCDNPPGPAPCPSTAPCLFNVVVDPRELNDVARERPSMLARMLVEYRALGATDCWRTDPEHGCQTWTTPEEQRALHQQTNAHLWFAPIGHAPANFPPPT